MRHFGVKIYSDPLPHIFRGPGPPNTNYLPSWSLRPRSLGMGVWLPPPRPKEKEKNNRPHVDCHAEYDCRSSRGRSIHTEIRWKSGPTTSRLSRFWVSHQCRYLETMNSRLECTRVNFFRVSVSVSRPEVPGLGLRRITACLVPTPVARLP